MHTRTTAVACTLLGSLMITGVAFAQTTATATGTDSSGAQVMCPAGCVPVTAVRSSAQDDAARARRHAARARRERERRERERAALESPPAAQEPEATAPAPEPVAEQPVAQANPEPTDMQFQTWQFGPSNPAPRGGGPTMPMTAVRHGYRPRIAFGLEGGVGFWNEGSPVSTDTGTGAAVGTGGSWGARVSVEFFPWLAIDGRYIGAFNGGRDAAVGPGVGLMTNGTSATLRLTAPFPFVQPYIFGGVGFYGTNVTGSVAARQASTLTNMTAPAVPFGVGINIPLGDHWAIGAEGTWHRFFGESNSTDERYEGGDLTTVNGLVRFIL